MSVGPLIALIAVAWTALLVATPILPTSIAVLIYGIGSFLCHQIPERSFHLGAFQLPVCARCLGIYSGFAMTALTQLWWRSEQGRRRQGLTSRRARIVFAIAALPTIMTVGLEWSGVWPGSNNIRAIAGFVLGIGLALVVTGALATLHYSSCEPRRPTAPYPPQRRI